MQVKHAVLIEKCAESSLYFLVLFPTDVFFSISLALMVASLLETVCIVKIQHGSSKDVAVPHWVSVLVLQYLSVVVRLPRMRTITRITFFVNPSTRGMSLLFIDINFERHEKVDDAIDLV